MCMQHPEQEQDRENEKTGITRCAICNEADDYCTCEQE